MLYLLFKTAQFIYTTKCTKYSCQTLLYAYVKQGCLALVADHSHMQVCLVFSSLFNGSSVVLVAGFLVILRD